MANRSFWAFIPARRQSQRFPNKVMAPLFGKPLVIYVYERIKHHFGSGNCFILVDDTENFTELKKYIPHVLMTSSSCRNGTERCFEAAQQLSIDDHDVILNIQGDEPLVDQVHIEGLKAPFQRSEPEASPKVSTVVYPLQHQLDLLNPNRVKVLPGPEEKCLGFFRRIPRFLATGKLFYLHGGFYGYTRATLANYMALTEGELEDKEKLEQIRFLGHDIPIYFTLCNQPTLGVDTVDDLKNVEAILKQQQSERKYSIRKDL